MNDDDDDDDNNDYKQEVKDRLFKNTLIKFYFFSNPFFFLV